MLDRNLKALITLLGSGGYFVVATLASFCK
jgi:hypothetical protein